MLTDLKAYSSWPSVPTLPLADEGREETDLIQIRNIDGLDPVKASVNTSPFGSIDGVAYIGSDIPARNIVLTLHPNPDWKDWTIEALRRLIYLYFIPKQPTKLVFSSDDISPVEISGIVESCEVNAFSDDVELVVSIICPDPYFTAVSPTVVTGLSTNGSAPLEIEYGGSVESGINVEVSRASNPDPTYIYVQVGDPLLSYFKVSPASVSALQYFLMNSIPGQKYVQTVAFGTGVITNLLPKMQQGSKWPVLQPGLNDFSVITDTPGHQDWQLTYFERFGGL